MLLLIWLISPCMLFAQSNIQDLEAAVGRAGNDSTKAQALAQLAEALFHEGQMEQSINAANRSIDISKNTSDIRLLSVLARAFRQQKQYASSLNYYLQAQKALVGLNKPKQLAGINMEIGGLYKEWGITEKAIEYFEPALNGWKELNDKEKVLASLEVLSDGHEELGNYEKALEYSKAELEYFGENANSAQQLNALRNISNLNILLDKPEEALAAQEEILALYQASGDSAGISSAYNNIGFLNRRMKNLEASLSNFQKSLEYAKKPSPVTYVNIGVIHQVLGNYEPSLLSFFESAKIHEINQNKEGIARVCNYISAVYQTLDDSENALRYTERAIQFGTETGDKTTLATSYKALSDIYASLGRNKRALNYYKEFVEILQEAQEEEKQKLQEALTRQVDAEEKENDLKLLLVDKELNQLSLRRLQLEAEKKEQQYQLALQKQELANAELEQKELEKERNLQELRAEKSRIEAEKKDNEIKILQTSDSLQKFALRQRELEKQERLKDIELLKQKEELQRLKAEEEKEKASQERQRFIVGIAAGAIVLLLILIGLILQRRVNAKLRAQQEQLNKQNLKLQEQADEITVQAEELLQQRDEISAQRDYIEDKNTELEKQKNAIEKAYNNIQILSDIGQQITSNLDLSIIIRTVYESVNRLMPATSFGIGIYNEQLHALEFKDFIEKNEVLPYSLDYIEGENLPSVRSFVERKEIVINNIQEAYDMFSVTMEDNRGEIPSSLIYMPLSVQDRVIGVITVQSFEDNAYSEAELTILRSIASYASIALENSNSYDQLMAVNEIIKEKNEQITDSLRYARSIEESILPTATWFNECFQDHFTIYRPKDIVSGDFYWGHSADGYIMLAAVDCTGHGVPGAFMSMIGNALLNRIIRENKEYDPATVLKLLNRGVKQVLNQEEHKRSEGMDVVLCRIKPNGERSEVVFAGAKRPLIYLENGKLQELKGDKVSIGWLRKQEEQEDEFHNQTIQLAQGSMLYFTTDGFVDNPAPNRIKIGSKQLKDMLIDNQHTPMTLQAQAFTDLLDTASEKREQRDDITLIGVKLK